MSKPYLYDGAIPAIFLVAPYTSYAINRECPSSKRQKKYAENVMRAEQLKEFDNDRTFFTRAELISCVPKFPSSSFWCTVKIEGNLFLYTHNEYQ
ncbi:hypothetical protein CEXT_242251 [Caerostris extrusa]|uniref:Uncharacterized protein n=1 Tax=Caerostris extrusa TaxID=172846 RepID=A0AAV4Y9D6_CAEEX|nr:hypothetical protein CEXT_242251 [Caerostris extrusa]